MEDINVPQIHSSAVRKFQKYATPAPVANVRVSGESGGPMHLERTAACSGTLEPLNTTLRCLKRASRPQNTAKLSKPHPSTLLSHPQIPLKQPLKSTTATSRNRSIRKRSYLVRIYGRENEQRTNLVPVMPNYTCVPYDSSISDFCTSQILVAADRVPILETSSFHLTHLHATCAVLPMVAESCLGWTELKNHQKCKKSKSHEKGPLHHSHSRRHFINAPIVQRIMASCASCASCAQSILKAFESSYNTNVCFIASIHVLPTPPHSNRPHNHHQKEKTMQPIR
ncbi:hypothetical protein B0J14DRAFT_240581 [Halenospora varia]|nr:hypothetical protein B0J14DRAFT_240581 [Halenospora varia]